MDRASERSFRPNMRKITEFDASNYIDQPKPRIGSYTSKQTDNKNQVIERL